MPENYFLNFNKLSYIRGEKPEGCILCHLVAKHEQIIDLSVYRDEFFIVSVNLYPYNPGHLLIIPVRHLEDIRELKPPEELRLCKLQRYFLDILDESHKPAGYNLGYNMGLVAGGSIEHLHLHIIPRYPNEIGITDLIAGKKVLVQDPRETCAILSKAVAEIPLKK